MIALPTKEQATSRLTGRRIVVTGGARGIGRAIVERVLTEGANVAVVDTSQSELDLASTDLVNRHPSLTVHTVVCDVTDDSRLAIAVDRAAESLGGLDGLVNNAGVLREEALVDVSNEAWQLTLAVNLTAPLRMTQMVVPHMIRAGGGSIVNISSIEGLRVRPRHASYAASKAALLQLTRSTAIELGVHNIRANAICPGSIDTEMLRGHIGSLEDPDAALQDLVGRNFAGRLGTPDEVAAVAAHLLSDEAAFTTGQHYVIDGARTVTT